MSTSDAVLAKRADEAFCGMAAFLREALREAKAHGDLEPSVDVNEAADAIVAYFEGLVLLAKTRNDAALIRRLSARAVHLATCPRRPAARTRKLQKPRS